MYLASQYDGFNNGDLTIAYSVARAKGITANGSLRRGAQELIEAGLIMLTRQGGRNRPSLYALKWFSIDECKGKLDVAATRTPPIDWNNLVILSELHRVQCGALEVQSRTNSQPENVH